MLFKLNLMHRHVVGALFATARLAAGSIGLATALQVSAVAVPLPIAPLQVAQIVPTLIERVELIDSCRSTATAVTIHKSSALNDAIGTVPPNASVTLTGIFGAGVVQIKSPLLGWIATNTLLTNCSVPPDSSLPADLDTNPRYCRRLRSAEVDGSAYADLNTGLVARNTPGGDFQYVSGSNQTDGPMKAAIVRFPGRATDVEDAVGRRWIRIKYVSIQGTPRVGWVANGPAGVNRNLAACSGSQN